MRLYALNRDDHKRDALFRTIEEYILNKGLSFSDKIDDQTIRIFFSTTDRTILRYPEDYEFQLESLYVDMTDNSFYGIVMSFENKGREYFALVNYFPDKKEFNIISLQRDIEGINTDRYNAEVLSEEFLSKLYKNILNRNYNDLVPISKNEYVDSYDFYSVSSSCLTRDTNKYLKKKVDDILYAKNFLGHHTFDYQILGACIDISNFNTIIIYSAYISLANKKYRIDLSTDGDIEELDKFYLDSPLGYFKAIVEYTCDVVESGGTSEIEAENLKEKKCKILDLIKNHYPDLGADFSDNMERIIFSNHSKGIVSVKDLVSAINLNIESGMPTGDMISYEDAFNDNERLFRNIDSALNQIEKNKSSFIELCNKLIEYKVPLCNIDKAIYDLQNYAKFVLNFFLDKKDLEELHNKAQEAITAVKSIKMKNINSILGSISNVKDEKSFNKYYEAILEGIDDLSDLEKTFVNTQFEEMLGKYSYLADYQANRPLIRKVYIRKKVLKELIDLSNENSELKIMGIMDSIVQDLKTIPGNELGKYLFSKGLNFPINEDRSIKKIRIMREFKYRLAFIYGRELGLDRTDNADDIYIFGITDHGKDKASLLKLKDQKPTKYKANDFILYTKNKIVRIPECSDVQHRISNSFVDNPVVTFGCAGSGKTTVSIEQYVNIVYSNFYPNIPSSDELVYVTFNKGLSEKARRDLSEYNITGNCYSLFEYFAYVLDRTFDKNTICVNEKVFVDWFNTYYSEKELKKNLYKRKDNLNPLLDKPDRARLIYTYYRGVFRGSKDLYNTDHEYLTEKMFFDAMEDELYLNTQEKKAIYVICKDFYDYASKNNYVGDNELALKVIKNKNKLKKTKSIIIDEVQDLTEIELLTIILTLNPESKKIYYYGDPNQSINPNIFNGSTINKIYSLLNQYESVDNKPLDITYRTNCHLISYLQKLEGLRSEWIGLNKDSRMSINAPSDIEPSTSWAAYAVVPELLPDILTAATQSPNSIVITPSDEVKEDLIKRYPNIVKERVISIYEAKGMEWETVIMYNMFTDYNTYFMDMVSENGNAKKSTIHRMTFNKYYVGCTRSTKSFILLEEDHDILRSEHPIFSNLISEFAPIYKHDQLNTFINEENTFDGWYAEAMQNLENDNEGMFKHALYHAERLAKTEEQKQKVSKLSEKDPQYLFSLGLTFLDQKDYTVAAGLFTKCHKLTKHSYEYVVLARVLSDRRVRDNDLKMLLKRHKDLLEKYPEAYINIINRDSVLTTLLVNLQKFYKDKKEEGEQ